MLRRLARRAAVHPQHAQQALHDLMDIPLQRVPHRHLLQRGWELRDNATAYDAAYLALAELLSVPLLTADERLAEIPGTTCTVDVFR